MTAPEACRGCGNGPEEWRQDLRGEWAVAVFPPGPLDHKITCPEYDPARNGGVRPLR